MVKIEANKKPTPAWLWFMAGLLSCALPVAAFSAWQYAQEQKAHALALVQQPASTLPSTPDYTAIRNARIVLGEQELQSMEGALIGHYQTRLEQLKNTSPFYLY